MGIETEPKGCGAEDSHYIGYPAMVLRLLGGLVRVLWERLRQR